MAHGAHVADAPHGGGHAEPTTFIKKYLFTVDHKVIGKQYMAIGLFMAIFGGLAAGLMRWELAWPQTEMPIWGGIGPDQYNALVTMHGTIMVFFVAMPLLLGAFGNFLVPIMIGADDMAFPRLNMASVWTMFLAASLLCASFLVDGGPAAGGWTGYPPLSGKAEYTGSDLGTNLWLLAIAVEFISFLMGGTNMLTTAMNLRTKGMTFFRMPLMVWMQLTASVLFLLSVGPLVAGAIMLLLDRTAGTGFFLPDRGGDPLLWQHLFWFFGHPEVYVIMLPGIGAVLEIFPAFTRKPIFGYRSIVWSTIGAGILSFVVWAHHMFLSGIDFRLASAFSVTTILISVPFAILVFAMIVSLFGGSITFETPMLFSIALLVAFLVGGVTGIFNGSHAFDIYIHDTYFVVAHFHYTLFPAVFLGGFGAIYFWFPKMFGRMYNEPLGKLHFWLTFIAFNCVFFPLFAVGMGGHMRRIYDPTNYEFLKPLMGIHEFVTKATFVLIAAQLIFVFNFFYSMFFGKKVGDNPWHANTLEWQTSSPPPHANFHTPPVVYRGPYEYSVPGEAEDYLPQTAVR